MEFAECGLITLSNGSDQYSIAMTAGRWALVAV
jgi:hypothetical protein